MADQDSGKLKPGRRAFLTGASLGGAALAMAGRAPAAAAENPPAAAAGSSVPAAPSRAMEVEAPATVDAGDRPAPTGASDYMVDALRGLGIEYIAQIPGSTFAPFQESLINHGMVTEPQLHMLTVTHEEISVALAHGYAKVAYEPAAALVHSTVGLQHASMALYNAWCDRAPVICLTGSLTNPEGREGWVDWMHAVSDGPALTRDFTKFDETPRSLPHFAESLHRAYRIAVTPPMGPVVVAMDIDLQEEALHPGEKLPVLKKPVIAAPQGDSGAVAEAAKILAGAQFPVICADHAARTPAGMAALVQLAEVLNCAVVDIQGRMNFPWRHPLNQTERRFEVLRQADVVLALDIQDYTGVMRPAAKARKISINSGEYYLKANYQTFQALAEPEVLIAGDSQATLPALTEAVRRELGRRRAGGGGERRRMLTEAHTTAFNASREAAALGWNERPITTGRMFAELYDQIRNEDWAIMGGCHFESFWPQRLWDAKQHHQFIGDSGGYGIGYLPAASVGAALAHKKHGRLAVVVGGDGDFMMAPGAIWTAVYHKIPMLYLIHNNGGYHQEVMKIQIQASRRDRGIDRAKIGTELPGIDYAMLARSLGAFGERVTDPGELRGAIARALAVVKRGEPALLDVVSQGR